MSRTFYNSPRPLEYNVDEQYFNLTAAFPENRKIYSFIDVNAEVFPLVRPRLEELGFECKYQLDSATEFNLNADNNFSYAQMLFQHKEHTKLIVDYAYDVFNRVQLYFMIDNHSLEKVSEIMLKLRDILSTPKKAVIEKNAIKLIIREGNNLATKTIQIKNELTDENVESHYNDDFIKFNTHTLDALKNKSTGIIMLHGEPGTGKTHYLRYLLNKNLGRNILYVPPEMTHAISDPGFLVFMMEQKNSILMIEDAETVLVKRQKGDGSSVANLLNLTDGILGDIMQCSIICTFNCHREDIDPALLRKGRLNGIYEFKKLSADKINTLCDSNNIKHLNKDMTIGDFYNRDSEFLTQEDKGFGFRRNE